MMTTMTIDQAKDHLAELLDKAAEGEEVIIVRDDGSSFSVTPSTKPAGDRGAFEGSMGGKIWMAPDFDDIPEGFEPYLGDDPVTGSDTGASNPPSKKRRGLVGSMKGQIWMAPDFDDIPEGFEPYLGDGHEKAE